MFNLAIDSKLRGCDDVALKLKDIAPNGYSADRGTVRQKKWGSPSDSTVDDYLRATGKKPGDFMFTRPRVAQPNWLGSCLLLANVTMPHASNPGVSDDETSVEGDKIGTIGFANHTEHITETQKPGWRARCHNQ